MIFIINDLKYDTTKMTMVANVEKWYSLNNSLLDRMFGVEDYGRMHKCELWRSSKGRWLLTSEAGCDSVRGEAITEKEAKELLRKYALETYEEMFGCLEEA